MNAHSKWQAVDRFLMEKGAFTVSGFEPGEETKAFIHNDCRILVIGAGGLGCELLKDLALLGFSDLHTIDMDTIEISNLNRQFLFRKKDVGRPKSEVAAEFIEKSVPGCRVTPHYCKLQSKDEGFYSQFNVIVSGLDSIEARRWMNGKLISMVQETEDGIDFDTVVPFVDGGSEGFKGHARVIIPRVSACFECTIELFPPQQTFPLCTIASKPRSAEHCISWASIIAWPKHWKDTKIDCDIVEHVQWLYEQARVRAEEFNITGVTYQNTLGVVKHIIPAIASTNAYVAAVVATEVFKIASSTAPYLNNYQMYNGGEGVYAHTFEYEKKDDCIVCGTAGHTKYSMNRTATLADLIESLKEDGRFQLQHPSLRNGSRQKNLYMAGPRELEIATKPNLEKLLEELVSNGETIIVTDSSLPAQYSLNLSIEFIGDSV